MTPPAATAHYYAAAGHSPSRVTPTLNTIKSDLQRFWTSSVRSKLRRRVRQATAAAPQKADADRGDLVSISNFTRRSDYLLTDREAIAAISQ